MSMTVEQIAALVGGRLVGDGAAIISGVNGIEEAGPGELVFVRDAKYARHLAGTRASAVLIQQAPEDCPIPAIEVGHPDVAFLMVLKHFEQALVVHPSGIHPAAVISPTATLGVNISLGPNVCIEDGAVIGDNTVLYAGVYIGRGTTVGADCVFYPNVVVREQCSIGARCLFQSGAIIGSDGFGFAPAGGQWIKVPQIGRVVIGDDVEIGSATCVDRATFGETRIGSGTKIDNLVQVGHNVRIGEHCAIAGTCGIAGSAKIGNHVRIGANSGIAGHIEIGDGATIAARAGVTNSVEPGRIVSGFPAIDHTEQRRVMVGQRKVPDLLRRVKELERKIQALEDTQHGESADHR